MGGRGGGRGKGRGKDVDDREGSNFHVALETPMITKGVVGLSTGNHFSLIHVMRNAGCEDSR